MSDERKREATEGYELEVWSDYHSEDHESVGDIDLLDYTEDDYESDGDHYEAQVALQDPLNRAVFEQLDVNLSEPQPVHSLSVTFTGEAGHDAGGLQRQWLEEVCREMVRHYVVKQVFLTHCDNGFQMLCDFMCGRVGQLDLQEECCHRCQEEGRGGGAPTEGGVEIG